MLFDLFVKKLHWTLHSKKWIEMLHYLNDFLTIVQNDSLIEHYAIDFNDLCMTLNFKNHENKIINEIVVDFLDIEFDFVQMKTRLSQNKHERVIKEIDATFAKNRMTIEKVQNLINFLAFVNQVVVSIRAFLRRLYNVSNFKFEVYHRLINVRADFQWWQKFLFKWNEVRILFDKNLTFYFWNDVSKNHEIEDFYLIISQALQTIKSKQTFVKRFFIRFRHRHINVKKMQIILQTLRLWNFNNVILVVHCDNFAMTFELNKSFIRDDAMTSLRIIIMIVALKNLTIVSKWIFIKKNTFVDWFSREKFYLIADKFLSLQTLTLEFRSNQNSISFDSKKSLSIV
jgi:hypothetical protein